MRYAYDDGGRAASGFKGKAGDCAARAAAIASGRPYREVYDRLNELAKTEKKSKTRRGTSSARTGVHRITFERLMAELGFAWTPTMEVGGGCRVHARASELPDGRLVLRLSRHYVAVVDGVCRDTEDPRRGGDRCVFGYWRAA